MCAAGEAGVPEQRPVCGKGRCYVGCNCCKGGSSSRPSTKKVPRQGLWKRGHTSAGHSTAQYSYGKGHQVGKGGRGRGRGERTCSTAVGGARVRGCESGRGGAVWPDRL
ncbi:hypothetical protein EJ04DRAFT_238699 [Polyplosphaeria fusca]|uniref:Uncharacterized protein n=1 Tax=Polyplosphaeria fusca TaxID=682080 RepID=A0A9P4V982_9PLEO|nr:hypothetical protein EJ04DRAFT_238699 [Polyplosphaeria fusca]